MSTVKWYKRDPNAALGGMMVLTLEERGAYNTVLDLIYSHDNNLIDDDHFIAGWCRCDLRVWKRIKARLLELGKIELRAGLVTNFRATSEIDEYLSMAASVSELNRIKGIKSGIARRKNNGLDEPHVEPETNTPRLTPRYKENPSVLKEGRKEKMAGKFALDENSEAFKAWEAFYIKTKGIRPSRTDIRPENGPPYRGWYFPSEYPPANGKAA